MSKGASLRETSSREPSPSSTGLGPPGVDPARKFVPPFKAGFRYLTTEAQPRWVYVRGQSAIDPDVYVCRIEGDDRPKLLMNCGSTYDGHLFQSGVDIWLDEQSALSPDDWIERLELQIDKLRTAIATEVRRAETAGSAGTARARPEGIAQEEQP